LRLDGEGHLFALFAAPFLVRRRRTERCVECNIGLVFTRGARLDVTAALALGVRARTASALAAGDLV
jgi:hypothetical protein